MRARAPADQKRLNLWEGAKQNAAAPTAIGRNQLRRRCTDLHPNPLLADGSEGSHRCSTAPIWSAAAAFPSALCLLLRVGVSSAATSEQLTRRARMASRSQTTVSLGQIDAECARAWIISLPTFRPEHLGWARRLGCQAQTPSGSPAAAFTSFLRVSIH